MRRQQAARTPLLAAALVLGGLLYLAASVGSAAPHLRTGALVLIAAALLLHLMRNADPAWLISGGIAASMFSGHWQLLGIRSSVVPDRVLLLAGVATVVLGIGKAKDRPPLQLRGVHYVLALALGYAVISMILSETEGDHAGVFALIDQFGAIPFLVFAVAPVAFRTQRQRNILLGSLVATGAYLGLTALFEKLKLTALIVPSYIADPAVGIHFGRARGPFVEAVPDGLALYACAVAAVIGVVVWRDVRARVFAAAVAVLASAGIVMTVTRAVWLGAIVASVAVLLAVPRLRRFFVPAAAAGLAIVLLALTAIPGLSQEANSRRHDQSPIWERKNSDAAALRMVAARPALGFGWFRHNDAAEPYFRMRPDIPFAGERAGLHNLFLTYAVDLGAIGFGLWLLGAALAFGGAVRGRAPPGLEPWRIGLGAIVACYITAGVAGPLAYVYPTLLLWTWAGVAYGLRGRAPAGSAAAGRRDDLERLPGKAA